jgi:hypothetical protein
VRSAAATRVDLSRLPHVCSTVYGCRQAPYCPKYCTNNGRYCQFDPDNDPNAGVSGRDIVEENFRQACLWQALNGTNQTDLWWDYVAMFQASAPAARCGLGCRCAP